MRHLIAAPPRLPDAPCGSKSKKRASRSRGDAGGCATLQHRRSSRRFYPAWGFRIDHERHSVRNRLLFVELARASRLRCRGARVGTAIAGAGWTLVYGGCRRLHGRIGRRGPSRGREGVGITPELLVREGIADNECDELVVTANMRDRKAMLEARGDAFVALRAGWEHSRKYSRSSSANCWDIIRSRSCC